MQDDDARDKTCFLSPAAKRKQYEADLLFSKGGPDRKVFHSAEEIAKEVEILKRSISLTIDANGYITVDTLLTPEVFWRDGRFVAEPCTCTPKHERKRELEVHLPVSVFRIVVRYHTDNAAVTEDNIADLLIAQWAQSEAFRNGDRIEVVSVSQTREPKRYGNCAESE